MSNAPFKLKPCKWTTWYKCLVCQKCFQFPNGLITHKKQTGCGKLYPTLAERNLLQRNTLAESDLSPEPPVCTNSSGLEISSTTAVTITANAETTDDTNKETNANNPSSEFRAQRVDEMAFRCSFCDKKFRKYSTLRIHMNLHTRNKCTVCGRILNNPTSLKAHMLIHEGRQPYSCPICQKEFRHPGTVKIHMLIHEGSKPFSCRICLKEFRQQTTLNNHMLIHEGVKPFLCNVCHKSFRQQSNINNHKCDRSYNSKNVGCRGKIDVDS